MDDKLGWCELKSNYQRLYGIEFEIGQIFELAQKCWLAVAASLTRKVPTADRLFPLFALEEARQRGSGGPP
jgi:hypothetical protein